MKNTKRMLKKAYLIAAKCCDKVLYLDHNWCYEPEFLCVEEFQGEMCYFCIRVNFNTHEVWVRDDEEGYNWTMWFQF